MNATTPPNECATCGGECVGAWISQRGLTFCGWTCAEKVFPSSAYDPPLPKRVRDDRYERLHAAVRAWRAGEFPDGERGDTELWRRALEIAKEQP